MNSTIIGVVITLGILLSGAATALFFAFQVIRILFQMLIGR